MAGRKLTHEQFVKKAITEGRNGNGRKGIHTVFSGFNEAFRSYFGEDPVKATTELARKGVVVVRPCRKGVMLYLKGEEPEVKSKGDELLAKITGGK